MFFHGRRRAGGRWSDTLKIRLQIHPAGGVGEAGELSD